jgi:hypothetical protein
MPSAVQANPWFAGSVMAAIRQDRLARKRRTVWIGASAAAVAAAFLFYGSRMATLELAPPPPINRAQELLSSANMGASWLIRAQEADGSWNPARWGGESRYQTALTALPIVALVEFKNVTPRHHEAIRKAAWSLLASQNRDGTFGPDFPGAAHNQGLAILALIRAQQKVDLPELTPAIAVALDRLIQVQTLDGGWGLAGEPRANRAVTLWHWQAVETAIECRWKGLEETVSKTRKWAAENGAALPIPQKPDCSAERDALLARQVRAGHDAGSWQPDSRWGRVGGRLYATSLAMLSLERNR